MLHKNIRNLSQQQVIKPLSHDNHLRAQRGHLTSRGQSSLRFHLPVPIKIKTTSLSMATLILFMLCLLEYVTPSESARSSADIGICETSKDGKLTALDCLRGEANFCCLEELIDVSPDGHLQWIKKCCTESEYMQENWYLVSGLLICTVGMLSMVIIIALSSFSSIILTEKESLE